MVVANPDGVQGDSLGIDEIDRRRMVFELLERDVAGVGYRDEQ